MMSIFDVPAWVKEYCSREGLVLFNNTGIKIALEGDGKQKASPYGFSFAVLISNENYSRDYSSDLTNLTGDILTVCSPFK